MVLGLLEKMKMNPIFVIWKETQIPFEREYGGK
jgi:hypothetical protein